MPTLTEATTTSPSLLQPISRRTSAAPAYIRVRHNRTRELDGAFLPTTMGGIHAALSDLAGDVAALPNQGAPHALLYTFASSTQPSRSTTSARRAPSPRRPYQVRLESLSPPQLRPSSAKRPTCGETPSALQPCLLSSCSPRLLFLVRIVREAGAPSTVVKAQTKARVDLWLRGELVALASRVAAAKLELPQRNRSKKAKAARRATALLRHNQFTKAWRTTRELRMQLRTR